MSRVVPAVMLVVGIMQMVADVTGARPLAAIAFATGLSPAPKVFTTQAGYEGFSTDFDIAVTLANGEHAEVTMTPERYARVSGPYNRRNALGAAIAGAPLLRDHEALAPMLDGVTQHALCDDARLLRELGLTLHAPVTHVRLTFRTRNGVRAPRPVEVTCR